MTVKNRGQTRVKTCFYEVITFYYMPCDANVPLGIVCNTHATCTWRLTSTKIRKIKMTNYVDKQINIEVPMADKLAYIGATFLCV